MDRGPERVDEGALKWRPSHIKSHLLPTINGPAGVHHGREGRRVYRVEAFLRPSGLGMGECVTRMSHHSPEMNTLTTHGGIPAEKTAFRRE